MRVEKKARTDNSVLPQLAVTCKIVHIPADSRPLIPVILGHLVRDFSVC